MCERTEISCAISLLEPRCLKLWPRIIEIHFYEKKAFIIPKAYIVAGPILFDELPLQQQSFLLVSNFMNFKVTD
jgi:hypothetical protein